MMFRFTSVGCFLLVIVLLNLFVLTDACHDEGVSCTSDDGCMCSQCCSGVCSFNCPSNGKRRRREVPVKVFGQR
nr:TPA_inf: conotoxin precursor I2 [Conus judaeus]